MDLYMYVFIFVVLFLFGMLCRKLMEDDFFASGKESLVYRCPDCDLVISTHPSQEAWLLDVAQHHKEQHQWMGTL